MASIIPPNLARFTRAELIEATGGECDAFDGEVIGVSSDSRAELGGGLFVALRGERFDGHGFAAAAVQRGARVILAEADVGDVGAAAVLRVPSTLDALGRLGAYHRRRWGRRLAAVAGSVGKTTTRTALFAVAQAAGRAVACPPGNLNNRIGVPMVLLTLTHHDDLCVVELGTSEPGEIERLTAMTDADVGVLTRISLEHSERLGGLDAIEHEEGALLRGLRKTASAVINADDERCVRQLVGSPAGRQLGYGFRAGSKKAQNHYRILGQDSLGGGSTRVRIERPQGALLDVRSPLLGPPGAYALTAALASVEALLGRSLSGDEVESALASPVLGEPGRLTPIELADGSLLLDDTYNSSPASVRSSVNVARQLADSRSGRLILVLGEMRELGALSLDAHREVGADLVVARPDLLVAFGGDAVAFLDEPKRRGLSVAFGDDAPAALELVRAERAPRDVVLVKASRSLRAERIIAGLRVPESSTP
ncbi:MAG TPA: Mur ligase family protein [Polyangiaceae bacterium]|nr:Mur ligase family protein [Polyangiaceae bacterium]